jgi:hypothetical protein
MKEKNKNIFILRLIAFIILMLTPIIYLVCKYNLFTTVNSMTIGSWGIIAIIITAIAIGIFLKYILFGKKWAYRKQIVKGVLVVGLPLGTITLILVYASSYLTQLHDFFEILTICRLVAYIVNPLPEWTYQKSLGEQEDFLNYVLDKRENRKK